MCLLSDGGYFAPPELQISLESWFYKHLVPPGPKNPTSSLILPSSSLLLRRDVEGRLQLILELDSAAHCREGLDPKITLLQGKVSLGS
jgi:hypothetical protein